MYTIDSYYDDDTGFFGYIIYDNGKPVSTSPALYESHREAIREASTKLQEADEL